MIHDEANASEPTMMKRQALSPIPLLILFSLLLAACGGSGQAPPQEAPVRPVKSFVIEGGMEAMQRRFPANVYASKRAELAFRVPGKVVEVRVKEGERVKAGDVLARLDDADYRIRVQDAQAQFDRARADFERARTLVKKGYISRTDYDRLESNFKTAKAALAAARNDLSYTTLRAPFDGRVGKRSVENFEEVRAKQAVFSLQSRDILDVKFNLPESLLLQIKRRTSAREVDASHEDEKPFAFVYFPGVAKPYPMRFKEMATRADPKTRTFEVTFTLQAPEEITVLPGMTAEVEVDFSALHAKQGEHGLAVPVTAVFSDPDGKPVQKVWVVDEDSLQVHAREVAVGKLDGDMIEIKSGLESGERVVTAGVHHLVEGQKVKLLDGDPFAELKQ